MKYSGKNYFYERRVEGNSITESSLSVSDYIPKETMMGWKGYQSSSREAQVFFYDEHKKFISSGLLKDYLDLTLDSPDNTGFMRIQNL